jgi:tRNA-binding protein
MTIHFEDFQKVDIRVGTIVDVGSFPEAKKSAYKLQIDFGSELGVKKTSAQITGLYTPETLLGKQVIAVVNFPNKQIGKFMSEVLVLGLNNVAQDIVLVTPDQRVENGMRLH